MQSYAHVCIDEFWKIASFIFSLHRKIEQIEKFYHYLGENHVFRREPFLN